MRLCASSAWARQFNGAGVVTVPGRSAAGGTPLRPLYLTAKLSTLSSSSLSVIGGRLDQFNASPLSTMERAKAAAAPRRRVRVYTRTGDKGDTSLYNGARRSKADSIFMALGDVDELNASVGIAAEYVRAATAEATQLAPQLAAVQSRLLDVGSVIATPGDDPKTRPEQLERVTFDPSHVEQLERWIDEMDQVLPPLRNFILPSGGLAAAHLHLARTICRRAERRVVELVRGGSCPDAVGRYLNRLSDYFFVAARFAAHKEDRYPCVYQKGREVIGTDGSAEAKPKPQVSEMTSSGQSSSDASNRDIQSGRRDAE